MNQATPRRVLVVEDDFFSAAMLEECLTQFGYAVSMVDNGQQAIDAIRSGRFQLVVSDWELPELDGTELCRFIRNRHGGSYIYVIMVTSRRGLENIVEGLNSGADDFISKPFQPDELKVRLRTAERILALESRDLLIFSLAKLAESRDEDTGVHLERIRRYSRLLAEDLAQTDKYREVVDGEYVQMIYQTSPLHDIGKVGIPDSILKKPGRLTVEEFRVMQQHAAIGGQTLDAVVKMRPGASFLEMARDIAWSHHEKFDGSGYPCGLAGEQIPLSARIVCLADVYDALTSKRVYKPAYSHETAREIILEGAGTSFDPDIVDAFLRQEPAFAKTCEMLRNAENESAGVEAVLG